MSQSPFYYNLDDNQEPIFCWVDNSQLILVAADYSTNNEQSKRVFYITEMDVAKGKVNVEVVRDEGFINETKFQAELLQFVNDLSQMEDTE